LSWNARFRGANGFGNGVDVSWRGAAAATHQVQPAVFGKLVKLVTHGCRRLVIFAESIGKARIGITTYINGRQAGQFFDIRPHLPGSQGAVDANAEQVGVRNRVPEGFHRLTRQGATAGVGNGDRNHYRNPAFQGVETIFNREQGGFQVEGVENRFNQQEIDSAIEQSTYLFGIGRS